MVLDASLLNTQRNKIRIKDKWSNLGKGVSSYGKRNPTVTLDYGRPTYIRNNFKDAAADRV